MNNTKQNQFFDPVSNPLNEPLIPCCNCRNLVGFGTTLKEGYVVDCLEIMKLKGENTEFYVYPSDKECPLNDISSQAD